ncbi:hypothetical protein C5167_027101 [Papaver somniferum]|nr:hypothetical protein C5167_027101 [Papaver somniferum]
MNNMKDAGTSKREHAVMEKIKEAHRRVMVANHPHKVGSMYLAKKINEAEVGLIVELEVIEQVKLVFYKTRRIINQEGQGLLLGLTDADDPIPRSSNGLYEEISFKILKQEVISRNVLVDECSRQVVEVEQAAMWKFLWW